MDDVQGPEREAETGEQSAAPRSRRRSLPAGPLGDWLRSLAIAVVLFLLVRTFVVEAYKIPTASMENTLLVGDFLLVNKAVFGTYIPGTDVRIGTFREPGRGDVIVFHPPHEPDKNYVKRIVGVPHDTLAMRDGRLYRNGALVHEPYAKHRSDGGDMVHPGMRWQSNYLVASTRRKYVPTRDNWGPLVVPQESYFVLGDNRDNSEDSRYWGFVSRDQIRGEPWIVYYSYEPSAEPDLDWLTRVRWSRVGELIR
ncbi:MAG TPA: signal peptidase I [Longimicrobiales bacterium]|nr:signal peptidase I [Longimicrobiales bacterium]